MASFDFVRDIEARSTFQELREGLRGLDLERLGAAEYARLGRALAALPGQPDVRLAYLSNVTVDLLPSRAGVWLGREGLLAAHYVGPYGQHAQELLDPGSGLSAFDPDAVLLALSLRELRPEAFDAFPALGTAARRALKDEILIHVEELLAAALQRTRATVLLANFVVPAFPRAGVADAKEAYGEIEFFLELNLELLRRTRGQPRVQLLDLDRLAARFGKDRVRDRRLWFLARMEWSEAFLPFVAEELARHVRALRGLARKVLVLDLDGTLWGGVVGEDGPEGIRVGPGHPEGEARLAFQRQVRALKDRGVLLAVASKNNPEDVREAFERRPEMALRLDDFAAIEVHWEPKPASLERIARALNVGTDSLVFVDDNPVEIGLVERTLPEVETLLLPRDPADHATALARSTLFERAAVLAEDRRKTDGYLVDRRREALRRNAGTVEEYLHTLGVAVRIRRAAAEDLPRAHQLFSKTNQFNLTTIRYGVGDLEGFLARDDRELGVVWARDRFGELGTIAVYLLAVGGAAADIDSFLMSCRAMGRGIETAVMNHVKARLREHPACGELRGRFRPTLRNRPAERFYDEQGFRVVERRDDEVRYALPAEAATAKEVPWIEILE